MVGPTYPIPDTFMPPEQAADSRLDRCASAGFSRASPGQSFRQGAPARRLPVGRLIGPLAMMLQVASTAGTPSA